VDLFSLIPVDNRQELSASNRISEKFGLTLTQSQMQELAVRRTQALRDTGRVEFGGGILPKLILAFCDSPYLTQADYARTLAELQELFYAFKSESGERLTDDELLSEMRRCFDGPAGGGVEYLAGVSLEELCRALRQGGAE
jgi:hypothetical protein